MTTRNEWINCTFFSGDFFYVKQTVYQSKQQQQQKKNEKNWKQTKKPYIHKHMHTPLNKTFGLWNIYANK